MPKDIPIKLKPEPYCPECGARMTLRRPKGNQRWRPFWGCSTWPDCPGKRTIADNGEPEGDDLEDEDLELGDL